MAAQPLGEATRPGEKRGLSAGLATPPAIGELALIRE
jgi:hypothetical protein